MKNKQFTRLVIFILVLLYSLSIHSFESVTSEILLMQNKFYLKNVIKLIRGAKNNIRVSMSECEYTGNENDITTRLLQELVNQAKRGVAIEVILEYSPNSTNQKNLKAKDFLYKNGIAIYNDSKDRYSRCNMVIVDDFTTVIGSIVWTKESLFKNDETEFWIESKDFAKVLIDKFNDIKIFGEKVR